MGRTKHDALMTTGRRSRASRNNKNLTQIGRCIICRPGHQESDTPFGNKLLTGLLKDQSCFRRVETYLHSVIYSDVMISVTVGCDLVELPPVERRSSLIVVYFKILVRIPAGESLSKLMFK